MATAIPAGKTFIDTLNTSFVDVPVQKENDNAIPTKEFLEASESLTTLFGTTTFTSLSLFSTIPLKQQSANIVSLVDFLGSAAFKPVKNDMIGNITVRLQLHYLSYFTTHPHISIS
jgi:hypothetical protein